MRYNLNYTEIIGVSVFFEQRLTRMFVGILERNKGKYCFTYDKKYLNYKKAIPLGSELPLTKQFFEAEGLFPFFEDRIPPKDNPEYPNYCKQFGVDPHEKDPLILLATIGKKGPSSFVFESRWGESFSDEDLKEFRNKLGLSTRDFAISFGISQATIVRLENKKASGTEALKLLGILHRFPDVAAYYVEKYAAALHSKTKGKLLSMLKSQQLGCWADILTTDEYDFSKAAGEALKKVPWAEKMLQENKIKRALEREDRPKQTIETTQPIETTKAALFEIRFALALYQSNLAVEYEHKRGTGDCSVDFMVHKQGENEPKWFIELTSLMKSDAIKESTNQDHDLYTCSSSASVGDKTNSAEVREIIKAQRAILSKVTETVNGHIKTIKFPKIDKKNNNSTNFNAIIVDMRAFNMGISDFGDYINILYGSKILPDLYKRYWINQDGKKELIQGLFDDGHPDPRSKILRENMHAVGFVKEKRYELNEVNTATAMKLYANTNLISQDELQKLWPLEIQ